MLSYTFKVAMMRAANIRVIIHLKVDLSQRPWLCCIRGRVAWVFGGFGSSRDSGVFRRISSPAGEGSL